MDMFSVLADPTRRQIIELLAGGGQLTATQIYDQFEATPPAISQHLKVLREAQVVVMQKRGQQHLYQLNSAGMTEVETWLQSLSRRMNARFEALDAVLEEEQQKLQDGKDSSD